MSLQFNDTTNFKGIVQLYERELGMPRGTITGNRLKELTADVNLAWDSYLALALRASGTWQFDDSNHTDYPILTTDLVANQRDYAFTVDSGSNLILEIQKVLVSDASGNYREVDPVDVQTEKDTQGFYNGDNATGVPQKYDKLANGIFLDPIPSYNYTAGLKIYVNREPSYFTSSDLTKKPGCPGIHHRYFYLRPALDYARVNNLANLGAISASVMALENDIEEYFGKRARDQRTRLVVSRDSNK
jgi:hypothetical protein